MVEGEGSGRVVRCAVVKGRAVRCGEEEGRVEDGEECSVVC